MKKALFFLMSLLLILLTGCSNGTVKSTDISSSTPLDMSITTSNVSSAESNELSVAQIYNIVKDYDYWYYQWDGTVKAFKNSDEFSLPGEKYIGDVQFFDGWIYYVKSYNDYSNDFDIFRVRPNGEDCSVVLNSSVFKDEVNSSFHSLTIVDGYMYIHLAIGLYRYNLKSRELEIIDGDVGIYHISNNRLYFIGHARRDFTIYVMDLTTKKTKILLGDGIYSREKTHPKLYYSNFIFINDVMFYTKRIIREDDFHLVELYRYKNGKSTLIDNAAAGIDEYSLFEYEGKLYYVVGKTTHVLKNYDPKTRKVSKIIELKDYSGGHRIINNVFYYYDHSHNKCQVKINP